MLLLARRQRGGQIIDENAPIFNLFIAHSAPSSHSDSGHWNNQKYTTVPRAPARVSERSGVREWSELYGASEQVSGASERASERVAHY